jgi:cytochrome c oxidase assembly protein subunit 15
MTGATAGTDAIPIATAGRPSERAIGVWLLVCCAMIAAMVVIGGVTRLTHSGLSMVEWRPLVGILPPLGETEWQRTFELYQATPEYQKINRGMSLAEFKGIFFWEYVHRVWGRLIGVVFAVPFLWFLVRRRIPRRLAPQLVVMFVLGGLQGLMGWYMVMSGLVDRPDVSQYRLTAHLGFAVAIFGYILWVALDLLRPRPAESEPAAPPGLRHFAAALAGLVLVTLLSGGFVAGLDAGFAYNTFPLMNGRLVPEGLFAFEPLWLNLFDNVATVQFEHRVLAVLTLIAALVFWLVAWRGGLPPGARLPVHGLAAMTVVQMGLGVATLLLFVPVSLAAAHQAGALALFTLALWTCFELAPATRKQP